MQNENIEIDVTIIATVRPDVLEKTLSSLVKMCPAIAKCGRVVLNIDNVPDDSECAIDDVVDIARHFLPNIKCVRYSYQPSFSRAVISAWHMTTARYVFHLEDDWEFVRPINLDECIEMIGCGDADYIRFSKRKRPIPEETNKIALLPGLWKGETVRGLARYMSAEHDPEKQLRHGFNEGVDRLLPKKIYDYSLSVGGIVCRDIGREWRDEVGLKKWNKDTPGGITWHEEKNAQTNTDNRL